MHDRRLDGETEKFGNNGALFMNAMTWWDWSTGSVWAQPWGLAIDGELRGARLRQLPMSLTTWGEWQADYPDSLVLADDRYHPPRLQNVEFQTDFVVGIALDAAAKSFAFSTLREEVVVNDSVGAVPVALYTPPGGGNVHAFVRRLGDRVLTFELAEGGGPCLRDVETGSLWDAVLGLAVEGPLTGQALQRAPTASAFDWAWRDFYPHSVEYRGRGAG